MEKCIIFLMTSICLIIGGCDCNHLKEVEIKILSKNFAKNVLNLSVLLDSNNTENYTSIIDLILLDLEHNNRIKKSRKEVLKLSNTLISERIFASLKNEARLNAIFIKENIDRFSSKEMSLIEEYNFVEKVLLCSYWRNWKEGLSFGFEVNIHTNDTLILYEYKNYEFPISIKSNGSNFLPFIITSNSLQKESREKIHIDTGKSEEGVLKKRYKIKAYNSLTGEEFTEIDSVFIKVIKESK